MEDEKLVFTIPVVPYTSENDNGSDIDVTPVGLWLRLSHQWPGTSCDVEPQLDTATESSSSPSTVCSLPSTRCSLPIVECHAPEVIVSSTLVGTTTVRNKDDANKSAALPEPSLGL